MKKLSLLLIIISTQCFSQMIRVERYTKTNFKLITDSKQITWYGVDYSNCKISNPVKLFAGEQMKDKYIPGWMQLIAVQHPLEKLADELDRPKESINEDFGSIQKLYNNMNKDSIMLDHSFEFASQKLDQIVSSYSLPQSNGIGLVLVIENINEMEKYISGYVTFFDIETKEILYSVRVKCPPDGFGFSQTWVGGVRDIFKQFSREYKKTIKLIKKES